MKDRQTDRQTNRPGYIACSRSIEDHHRAVKMGSSETTTFHQNDQ